MVYLQEMNNVIHKEIFESSIADRFVRINKAYVYSEQMLSSISHASTINILIRSVEWLPDNHAVQ